MVRNGIPQCASKGLTIRMKGMSAHASQRMEESRTARGWKKAGLDKQEVTVYNVPYRNNNMIRISVEKNK